MLAAPVFGTSEQHAELTGVADELDTMAQTS